MKKLKDNGIIKGMVLVIFLIPFLELVLKLIMQATELVCMKMAKRTLEIQQEAELSAGGGERTFAMGFSVDDEEYYDEEEEF